MNLWIYPVKVSLVYCLHMVVAAVAETPSFPSLPIGTCSLSPEVEDLEYPLLSLPEEVMCARAQRQNGENCFLSSSLLLVSHSHTVHQDRSIRGVWSFSLQISFPRELHVQRHEFLLEFTFQDNTCMESCAIVTILISERK